MAEGTPHATLEPEDALLLTCVCAALDQPVARPDPAGVRWPVFARRVAWHGLLGVVQPVVRRWFEADMPGEVDARLRRAVRRQASFNLKLAGALRDVDAALRVAGVRYMILKGLPLAHAVYGSIGARRCRDIDVLVAPPAFTAARQALEEIGFSSDWGLDPAREAICLRFAADLPLRRADSILVELHHSLDFNPRTAGDACARSLLAAARPCPAGPLEVPSVVGPAALSYLAWHGAHHAWIRLFWLLDVAAITHRADERELVEAWEAAGSLEARRPLALAWRLCEELLGVPAPAPSRSAAGSAVIDRLSVRARRVALGPVGRAPVGTVERRLRGLGWSLALTARPRDRVRLLLRYLADVRPEEVRSLPLPPGLRWLYRVLRPFRVGIRLAAALGRRVGKRMGRNG